MFGSAIVRKAVMGTADRLTPKEPNYDSQYRLNRTKGKLEAAAEFALGGSVINEGIHTGMFVVTEVGLLLGEILGDIESSGAAIGTAIIHLPLIALQRYNRSRMIQRVNDELANGAVFDLGYRNSFGIDSRAVESYYAQHNQGVA